MQPTMQPILLKEPDLEPSLCGEDAQVKLSLDHGDGNGQASLADIFGLLRSLEAAQSQFIDMQRHISQSQQEIREEHKEHMATVKSMATGQQEITKILRGLQESDSLHRAAKERSLSATQTPAALSEHINYTALGLPGGLMESARYSDGQKLRYPSEDSGQSDILPCNKTCEAEAPDAVVKIPSTASLRSGSIIQRKSLSGSIIDQLLYARDDAETISGYSCRSRVRRALRKFVLNEYMDTMMGPIIFLNCACIGLEIDYGAADEPTPTLDALEHVFLICYCAELFLRFWALGPRVALSSSWIIFDAVLVSFGTLTQWVIEPVLKSSDFYGKNMLGQIMILRVMRLLRLIRALRLITMFHILWRLVNGLLQSYGTILATFFLLALSLYVFACIGVEAITKNKQLREDPEIDNIVWMHFTGLSQTMLTLARFITLDSIGSIYEPLIWANPMYAAYFVPIGMVVSISLMNLVTAFLVDTAINQSQNDREFQHHQLRKQVKHLVPTVKKLFDDLDANEDGSLTIDEVDECWEQVPDVLKQLLKTMSLAEVIESMDLEGHGHVKKDEFIDGVIHIALSDCPIELTQQMHHFHMMHKQIQKVYEVVRQMQREERGCADALVREILTSRQNSGFGSENDQRSIPTSPRVGQGIEPEFEQGIVDVNSSSPSDRKGIAL